jgi:hypothetical protein
VCAFLRRKTLGDPPKVPRRGSLGDPPNPMDGRKKDNEVAFVTKEG